MYEMIPQTNTEEDMAATKRAFDFNVGWWVTDPFKLPHYFFSPCTPYSQFLVYSLLLKMVVWVCEYGNF